MRTITLQDELIEKVLKRTTASTDNEAVAEALEHYLKIKGQEDIFDLVGQVEWNGNLDESRLGRVTE